MKILFICKANVGRSQIAKAFFNKYSKKNSAISAGTNTFRFQGQKLSEFALPVVDCMNEVGINVASETPTQLTPELVNSADRIYAIVDKSEWPDYLLKSDKVISWNIEDGANKDYATHIRIRNEIEELVKQLVSKIG